MQRGETMTYYTVHFNLCDDPRIDLKLDQIFTSFDDALNASLELESDPDIYTSWVVEVTK